MKKSRVFTLHFFTYSILLTMLFLSTTFPSIASISTNVKIYVDDVQMEFGLEANDPGPYIKEGRTLVPFRRIFEEVLSMEVLWDADERKVTAIGNDIEMILYIDGKIAYVNGEEKELDVPAAITDDRTFVPLRFVSENCGADVGWEDSTKSVFITLPAEITQPIDDKPGSPNIEIPPVEKKKLGEAMTYNKETFSFSVVALEDLSVAFDKKLIIKGSTDTKDSTLMLEIFDETKRSVKTRAYAQPSVTGVYEFRASTYVPKTFKPKYMNVYTYNENDKLIQIAEYEI